MQNRLPPNEPHVHYFDTEFIIRSIGPSLGCKAVYADFLPDTGEAFLFAVDLDFLGIATAVIREYCDTELVDRIKVSSIVGIEFVDGVQRIANDQPNFAGLMPVGKEIEECCGALEESLFARLPAHVRRRNEHQ